MIPLQFKLIGASALLALSFGAGWLVQGQRLGLRIEQLKHTATSAELAGTRQAVKDMAGFQKGFNDALANFQQTQQTNTHAQQELGGLLRDLRGTAAGLRGDFAGLPDRIARAAQPALAEYASTCSAVFETMAAAGGRLAEGGAGIAAKAEGHAADAKLMQQAWPQLSEIKKLNLHPR